MKLSCTKCYILSSRHTRAIALPPLIHKRIWEIAHSSPLHRSPVLFASFQIPGRSRLWWGCTSKWWAPSANCSPEGTVSVGLTKRPAQMAFLPFNISMQHSALQLHSTQKHSSCTENFLQIQPENCNRRTNLKTTEKSPLQLPCCLASWCNSHWKVILQLPKHSTTATH